MLFPYIRDLGQGFSICLLFVCCSFEVIYELFVIIIPVLLYLKFIMDNSCSGVGGHSGSLDPFKSDWIHSVMVLFIRCTSILNAGENDHKNINFLWDIYIYPKFCFLVGFSCSSSGL